MRILLVSGGSIGHIAPLVAIWRAVERLAPSSETLLLCADREEELLFSQAEGIRAIGLARPRIGLTLGASLLRNTRSARKALDTFMPDVVVSKGGAVSIPTCMLAWQRGIPVILHESDALMGRANRLLSRFASRVCLGHAGACPGRDDAVVTGNPVRAAVFAGTAEHGRAITGFHDAKPVLLVLGGSQGAAALNAAIRQNLDALLADWNVVHLTGHGKQGAAAKPGYWSKPFAQEELPHLYALAAAAISRAGAGAIAELAANAIPTLLVPLRGLAQDHQWHNARSAEKEGWCRILEQGALTTAPDALRTLLADHEILAKKANAAQYRSREAAEHIATVVLRAERG